MIILVQTIDANNQSRHFSWVFPRLELAFDVLNAVASTGAKLVTVELIDNDKQVQLSIDASSWGDFPFMEEIQQLEYKWQQLLSASVNEQAGNQPVK